MITLILVDDQPAVRQGLRMRLAMDPDVKIIGETDNGAGALDLIASLDPDVVVMDIAMPVLDGVTVTTTLRDWASRCGVVILTIHDDEETRGRALAAGAGAFIGKHQAVECLPTAIREVASHIPNRAIGASASRDDCVKLS